MARASTTLGTCAGRQSPGACAARPAGVAGAGGDAPSGAVSSGGVICGGAGEAGSTRTSQPLESVLACGTACWATAAQGMARQPKTAASRERRRPIQARERPGRAEVAASRVCDSSLVPPLAAGVDFLEEPLAVFGLLLIGGALVAGLARRSFLSLTAAFVVAGFVLGQGGLEVLDFDPHSGFVQGLAVIALILILFRDGLEVDEEMLHREWHLPLRNLILATPITAVLVALLTHAVTDLSWTESFLVGALLSPTDPVLSSTVVNNPRVPRIIRHSLNLESGLNDGLALPAVLAFVAALERDTDFVWWRFVLQDVGFGLATGIAVAFVASRLMPRTTGLGAEISAHQKSLFALGVAFASYGLAVLPPEGNGLISVFVTAIALGIWRPDIGECFVARAEDLIEVVKLGVFLVFGAILTLDGLFQDGWAAVAIAAFTLLVARPVALFAAQAGSGRVDFFGKAFMAWFGPKGVATMTFALFVLGSGVVEGERIANLAALVVFISIIAHGLTDHPGSELMAQHAEREPEPATAA
jgi:sodium/hydrogen antiporter